MTAQDFLPKASLDSFKCGSFGIALSRLESRLSGRSSKTLFSWKAAPSLARVSLGGGRMYLLPIMSVYLAVRAYGLMKGISLDNP